MSKKERVRYYRTYSDDFVETKDQEYKLSADYEWVRVDLFSRILSAIIYFIAAVFSSVYCRLFLHMRIKNAKALRKTKDKGVFIYANHTQPFGDVFIPALAALPKRVYVIVSSANYAIPVLGKILPYLGALPIPDSVNGMKKFMKAIECRLMQNKGVVIYPEAHVWEYCTEIRPFGEASFRYPVKYKSPVFCMTNTYQKRKFGKKPRMTSYVDGPFYTDENLNPKEQASELKNKVYECMKERSLNSNYEYYRYVKVEE